MSLPREWSLQTPAGCSLPSTTVLGRNDELADSYNLLNFATENTGVDDNQNSLAGSLFSVHSAPVPELNVQTTTGTRPASLVISAEDTRSVDRALPCLLTPPDTADDEDNDNLLTISSLTARPLIAKSRELRCSKLSSHKNKKRPRRIKPAAADPEDRIEPPDGGYGWIVVCGAFFVQFWVAGLVKSYGVLFVEIMEAYSDSSASVASWIPAILSALCLALAPLSSALCQKFSCRIVVFTGGLFCALGLTLSYFATRLIHLFFTFGVLTGIGGGLSTTPGIVMVSQYFDKHRALANGITISGTAAGSFVFPLLIEHLCDTFGFHGTILLLGGCMLHVCVSAMLYRPIKPTPAPQLIKPEQPTGTELEPIPANKKLEFLFVNQPNTISTKTMNAKVGNNLLSELFNQNAILIDPLKVSDSEEEKDQIGETILIKRICSFRSSSILHSVEDLSTDSTCVYKSRHREPLSRSMFLVPTPPAQLTQKDDMLVNDLKDGEVKKSKKTCLQKISQYLDLSLLKDGKFIMMCLSVTLMSTGSPYMLYYLPVYVISTGYTKSEAGYLVAISAALDLCGRLGLGWLSDLQLFDRRKGYIGSMVGAGVAVLVIPVADSFYVLACSVGMYGLCLGCWFLLVPVLLADQYGTDKISSSYGLVRMFQSVGAITVPPLAGYIRDVTGGYEYCFYCMGTCMVLGGVPLLLVSGFPCFVNESDVENGSQTDQNTTEK